MEKRIKSFLRQEWTWLFEKIVSQIDVLNKNKLCRKIYVTDVVPIPKNNFETWNDDGREWRESVLKCSTLERFESMQGNRVQHEIYRKNSYLRILQSRHVRRTDKKENKKSYYHDMLRITCPSCGARVKLNSQQVTCEYCGAVIKTSFTIGRPNRLRFMKLSVQI